MVRCGVTQYSWCQWGNGKHAHTLVIRPHEIPQHNISKGNSRYSHGLWMKISRTLSCLLPFAQILPRDRIISIRRWQWKVGVADSYKHIVARAKLDGYKFASQRIMLTVIHFWTTSKTSWASRSLGIDNVTIKKSRHLIYNGYRSELDGGLRST
jgi:hypothetical protein